MQKYGPKYAQAFFVKIWLLMTTVIWSQIFSRCQLVGVVESQNNYGQNNHSCCEPKFGPKKPWLDKIMALSNLKYALEKYRYDYCKPKCGPSNHGFSESKFGPNNCSYSKPKLLRITAAI